jgi:hypothetical protein
VDAAEVWKQLEDEIYAIAKAENRDDVIPEEAAVSGVAQPQPQSRRLNKTVVDILSGLERGHAEDNNEEVMLTMMIVYLS